MSALTWLDECSVLTLSLITAIYLSIDRETGQQSSHNMLESNDHLGESYFFKTNPRATYNAPLAADFIVY